MATNGREPDKRKAFSGNRARCTGRGLAQTAKTDTAPAFTAEHAKLAK